MICDVDVLPALLFPEPVLLLSGPAACFSARVPACRQIYLQAWATGGGAAEGRVPVGDALDADGSPSGASLL